MRLELARKAYDEVLDATKHQDDKIGRFLTVIAFFTAAVFTLSARLPDIFRVRFSMSEDLVALPAILLGLFLLLTVSAVLLFVVGLGPNLSLPGQLPGQNQVPRAHSHLFFLSIASLRLEDWNRLWAATPKETRRQISKDMIQETHNIATKAYFKYRRGNEGRAVFILSLLSLSIGLGLGLWGLFVVPTLGNQPIIIPWAGFPRFYSASVFAAFCLVLGYDFWRAEWEDARVGSWLQTIPTLVGTVSLATYSWAVVGLGSFDLRKVGAPVALGSMVAICLGRIAITGMKYRNGHLTLLALILPITSAIVGWVVIWNGWAHWQLALAGGVVCALEIPRVYRPPDFRRWWGSGLLLALLGRERRPH